MYVATGTITFIDGVQKLTESFEKQVLGIDVEGRPYPTQFFIDCVNEKRALLKDLEAGDRVKIDFTPICSSKVAKDGKTFRFTSLRARTIEKLESLTAEEMLQTAEANA